MAEEKQNRIVETSASNDDSSLDLCLRPKVLDEYIGQTEIKQNLNIFLGAAKKRGEPIEHVLLYGPPGLGKTTLAYIIAKEMGVSIKITTGPAIERSGDLAAILTNLQPGDILFIDEIHRLNRIVEEVLYPAMEDYVLDIVIGKGPSARTVRLNLPKFTLIGATTKISKLSSPLRDRFGNTINIGFYSNDELQQIVERSAKILNIAIDPQSASEIAKRSRKTPRIANRLLKRVRDYAEIKNNGILNLEAVKNALTMLSIDELGLDSVDQKILLAIIEKFGGGPVGLNTLAAATAEELEAIEDVYEPFLLQEGFIDRTNRGRIATDRAFKHFNKPAPTQNNKLL
ncbi:Holliday junction branch migration DNA helicase RuvB [Candidatus Falkowbacteria bacterium]|nr:Holliday junction branch migration DNA helicase RuvB [Candidatus Falkowbacteria bacterium]